ncbi:MAG: hypothetical protein AAGK47_10165 [Bacteroidota bacterium]
MQTSLSMTNILKSRFEQIIDSSQWLDLLLTGKFYDFEQQLHQLIYELYDLICYGMITSVSEREEFVERQKAVAADLGLKKLESRMATVQLRTGTKIRYESLYAKQAPVSYESTRHLSQVIWKVNGSASPMYQGISCLFSVLCPSFSVAQSLMKYSDIGGHTDRIRQVSLSLAEQGLANRTTVQLSAEDTLADKRVVIAIDGGRTRTRVYTEDKKGRDEKFSTPWREPKMLVISTCDAAGKMNQEMTPIYDATYGDDEIFALLADYLRHLEIEKCRSVQLVADGAPWIWNRGKSTLLDLGVAEEKIIETLDYYHAIEHLTAMKVYFEPTEQESCYKKLKAALWQGDFSQMKTIIQSGISDIDIDDFSPFKYFKKQQNRIDYQGIRAKKLPCGSGLVESAIRRIINLRFKSPSSFWYPENAEKLMFMRGVALSGRWGNMMDNLFS